MSNRNGGYNGFVSSANSNPKVGNNNRKFTNLVGQQRVNEVKKVAEHNNEQIDAFLKDEWDKAFEGDTENKNLSNS